MAEMQTPLRRVIGLGSAHEGTGHFWRQRLTGIANVPLVIGSVVIVASVAGRPYEEVVAILSSPLPALILLLMTLSVTIHMRIGIQVLIEDYVHGPLLRPLVLAATTFFSIAVGVASAFAVLKLALGG